MATTVARLEAVLSADTRNFDRSMDQSKGKMSKMGKVAGAAGLAIFAGLGVVAKRGFDEMKESQEVMAQTEAGLKSTGGAAKVTGKDITGLANRLSKLSGVDDELIQQGENLLLTFTKVRNEVGKGNRIFDRAATAALDLSVRGFGSMESTSKMLGKALQDPVRGLTALGRAGVTFSDSQKIVIKGLVEGVSATDALVSMYEGSLNPAVINSIKVLDKAGLTWDEIADKLNLKFNPAQEKMLQKMTEGGHTLEAQRLIMKEVEMQVGGSAKAYGETLPGQMAKAKNAFDEIAAKIVVAVLPALTRMLEKLATMFEWLDKNPRAARAMVIGLGVLATALFAASVAQLALNLAVLANPYVASAVAVAILTLAIIVLWRRSDDAKEAIIALSRVLGPAATAVTTVAAHFDTLRDSVKAVHGWVLKVIDAVKDMIRWIGKIKIPDINLGRLNPFGDPRSPGMVGPPGGGTGPTSISSRLYDELAGAHRFGLRLTSGHRPGAVTRSGTPSDHGMYPSNAIDVAGSSASMAGFFRWLIGQRDVKQAFYDPLGSIFGGMLSSYREGGHSDHVHVATYDRGGWLMPGLTLAANNTGRPERVGGSSITIHMPNYVGSRQEFLGWLKSAITQDKRHGGLGFVG